MLRPGFGAAARGSRGRRSSRIRSTSSGETWRRYHGPVFTLDDIRGVVDEFGMPGNRWKTVASWQYDWFQVQARDERPLRRFANRRGTG
jgi:hypothetical protein